MMSNSISFLKSNIMYLLRLCCRYFIAFQMFSYAFAKILGTQFNLGVLYTEDYSIDNFNGFMLTWNYYGYSKTYGMVIAITQIIAALLLLFRKTVRLGAVLFLSFMVNIVFVDIFYEINEALWMAVPLTAMGIFILLTDWKGFSNYFLRSKENIALVSPIIPTHYTWFLGIKIAVILGLVIFQYQHIADLKKKFLVQPELYGVWRNVSGYQSDRIHKITFSYRDDIKIRDYSDQLYYGKVSTDSTSSSLNITAKHYGYAAYHYVNDSVQKLPEEARSEELKQAITSYYQTFTNTQPFEEVIYTYHKEQDTLLLKRDTVALKFLKIK